MLNEGSTADLEVPRGKISVRDRGVVRAVVFFFFSSRRRHTRCSRDWSSDVCSSDLTPSLLSDCYPPERRARVLGIFYAAIPVGSALGYVVGGLVGEHFGWRAAFFVAGGPGRGWGGGVLVVAWPRPRPPRPPRPGRAPAPPLLAPAAGPLVP